MDKQSQLEKLREEISRDSSLPLREANLVFGEGNPDCTVMFIGEAPGFNEDQQGRPFVGRAGQLLDKLMTEIGWKRERVYITNIVKRRPPENRDPLPEEIAAYTPYLKQQIEIINPPIIATLGRFSMNYFLPLAKISRDRGKIFTAEGRKIFPLFHPAAALRNPDFLAGLREDFKRLPLVTGEKSADLPNSPPAAEERKSSPKPPTPAQEKLF